MAWKLVFEGGCLDGHERDSEEQPEPCVTVCGPIGAHRAAALADLDLDVSDLFVSDLLLPGQWARYQLQFGVFPGPMRYRLVEECLEPF